MGIKPSFCNALNIKLRLFFRPQTILPVVTSQSRAGDNCSSAGQRSTACDLHIAEVRRCGVFCVLCTGGNYV